jgi:addiction module HigA family antidote
VAARSKARIHIHPGEILKEEFLVPLGISANRLAGSLGVPANRISAIINGDRGITAETAILLGRALQTTPEFWINLQAHYDLELARSTISADRVRSAERLAKELRQAQ